MTSPANEDFKRFGARTSAYGEELKLGPIVVTSSDVRDVIRRRPNPAPADRPMKIFSSVSRVQVWLHMQPRGACVS